MAAGGHVMEHQAAVAVHGVDHLLHRAEAGDDDRHAMLDAQGQVGLQARIARMDDQVDGIGCWRLQLSQACLDLLQPGLEAALSRWLSAGKLPTTPLAAGQHQLRVGNQEHRRGHQWQAQPLLQQGGQGHGETPVQGGLCQNGLTTTRITIPSRIRTGTSLNQR
jgi:hypothetical protein